ncbi:peptide ABC transporter substrate-binding protein [Chromatiales bacterium (ex Bugula neritina AB1)]|nr:peptide ABC transporter substrate-binding protein [Chromatiales bacterium (ex Bugula neritina AB1)]
MLRYCFCCLLLLPTVQVSANTSLLANLQESDLLSEQVASGELPSVVDRVPEVPLVVDLKAGGRKYGKQGGTLRTMVSRSKDIRQMVVLGYARLVIHDRDYSLAPDILESYEVVEGRKFTLRLRPGHRWSDGHLFTSADFEYWWTDVANNPDLAPAGPPQFMRVNGALPTVTFPDAHTVVYAWEQPNPYFLPLLAQARPPFIFRPRHYLEQYHQRYADPDKLAEAVEAKRVRSWNSLHNKLDNMYKFDNPDLPTLQPWITSADSSKNRRIFVRNPYYHRVDQRGTQLPYIDKVEMSIVGGGLIPAKSNAGEADLQARGLNFSDVSILKKGEVDGGNYRVLLWSNGSASQMAIYPNLNFADPVWRKILRDIRFRRALSLGIDRRMINRALYFGLGVEGGMSCLSASPLHTPEYQSAWSSFDLEYANALLDEIGLTERQGDGIRLLPDGRPLRLIIETAGERQEVENALQITVDTWRDLGIELVMRPLDRDILRMHVNSGASMASVWFGWDNGIPTANTSPAYLAPTQQEFFAWPMWGQYHQTGGKAGEPPDIEEARQLMRLSEEWVTASSDEERRRVWEAMLKIHADQLFGIGMVAETPQPIVVSRQLRNVPETALWAWQPGAHFGIHRPDEFYFDTEESM